MTIKYTLRFLQDWRKRTWRRDHLGGAVITVNADGVRVVSETATASAEVKRMHCGTKPGHFETLKIHFPTSEGVSEVSERANKWAQRRARAKRAVRSKWTSERCEQTSERTREWPSTYVSILVCSRPQWNGGTGLSSTLGQMLSHSIHCMGVLFVQFLLSVQPSSRILRDN